MAGLALVLVPPDRLPDFFAGVRPMLESAAERSQGKVEPVDLVHAVVAGDMQLWAVVDGTAIIASGLTEFARYPRRRVCRLIAWTGEDRTRWLPLIDEIEAWAKAEGCAALEPVARGGWERDLKARGYRTTHVVMAKEL